MARTATFSGAGFILNTIDAKAAHPVAGNLCACFAI
jgi:hypothetical protein